jgi:hypothetical protein
MSVLGVQVSIALGPLAAVLIARESAKERKPESLRLSDTALLIFIVAFAWLVIAGFWHLALGGDPADFFLASDPFFKYRLYIYIMYCGFSASLSLWCICGWQWLVGRKEA